MKRIPIEVKSHASFRVTAVARCTRFHGKGTKTNQGDVLTTLQRSGYDGCEGFQRASGSGLRAVGGARYGLDEVVFIYVWFLLLAEW